MPPLKGIIHRLQESCFFMSELSKPKILPHGGLYENPTCPQSKWHQSVSSSLASQRSHNSLSSASTCSGHNYQFTSTIHPCYNEPDASLYLDEHNLSDWATSEKQSVQSELSSRWHSRASMCSSTSTSLTSLSSIDPRWCETPLQDTAWSMSSTSTRSSPRPDSSQNQKLRFVVESLVAVVTKCIQSCLHLFGLS